MRCSAGPAKSRRANARRESFQDNPNSTSPPRVALKEGNNVVTASDSAEELENSGEFLFAFGRMAAYVGRRNSNAPGRQRRQPRSLDGDFYRNAKNNAPGIFSSKTTKKLRFMTKMHPDKIASLVAFGILAAILAPQISTAQTTPPPEGTVNSPGSVLHGRTIGNRPASRDTTKSPTLSNSSGLRPHRKTQRTHQPASSRL